MPQATPTLERSFYARNARVVAVDLLGKRLVRKWNGSFLSGTIVETEAYCDFEQPDLACHGDRANNGRPTARTEIIFGQAGFAYVYLTYGIHWMFNVVAGAKGVASAVLIRALQPTAGQDIMQTLRPGKPLRQLTNGPAKLAQALAINKSQNKANLCDPNGVVWIEDAPRLAAEQICTGPRIGLGKTPEPWLSMPWRYWVCDNEHVSR